MKRLTSCASATLALGVLLGAVPSLSQAQTTSIPVGGDMASGGPQSVCVSFNEGMLPSGWLGNSCNNGQSAAGYSVSSEYFYTVSGRTPPSNTTSLKLVSSGMATKGQTRVWAPFVMKLGYKYSVNVYVRSAATQEVVVKLREKDAPYAVYGLASKTVNSNGWTLFSFEGRGPLSGDVNAGLFIEPKQDGTIYVDNASVTETVMPVPASGILRTGNALSKSFFGIHEHRDSPMPTTFVNASKTGVVGARRIWDLNGAQLSSIFPDQASVTNHKGNWGVLDTAIADAQAQGIDLIMTLGGNTPAWASYDKPGTVAKGCDNWGGGGTSGPVDLLAWSDMVAQVLEHAQGKIKYWESWNEPYNCVLFTQRRPVDWMGALAYYSQEVSTQVKNYNAAHGTSLKVLTPSFSTEALDFVDEYMNAARTVKVDYVSVHAYDPYLKNYLLGLQNWDKGRADAPEAYFVKEHGIDALKSILNRYSATVSAPLLDTESGYLASSNDDGSPNDRQGAPYVARHLLLSAIAGIDASYYYALDQGPDSYKNKEGADTLPSGTPIQAVSLVRGSGANYAVNTCTSANPCTRTDAGRAYEVMANWLTGATIKELCTDVVCTNGSTPSPTKAWRVTLQKTVNGVVQTQYIVWYPTESATAVVYPVPAGYGQTTPLLSSKVAVSNNAVTLTGAPQLLTIN